jgi:hypothetical protein
MRPCTVTANRAGSLNRLQAHPRTPPRRQWATTTVGADPSLLPRPTVDSRSRRPGLASTGAGTGRLGSSACTLPYVGDALESPSPLSSNPQAAFASPIRIRRPSPSIYSFVPSHLYIKSIATPLLCFAATTIRSRTAASLCLVAPSCASRLPARFPFCSTRRLAASNL